MKQYKKRAALFDWDGVIIDSSNLHEESWERLGVENSRSLPEGHFKRSFGMRNENVIPEILDWQVDDGELRRLSLRKEEIYRELVQEKGLFALDGVVKLLEQLKNNDIPCAVGSSTHRKNIEVSLQALNLSDYFSALITSENVSHGKPHPEVFLKGAETLNVAPEHCVVFEDAPVGITAGKAAGMRVIAVTTSHPAEALYEADLVVDSLGQVGIEDLYAG